MAERHPEGRCLVGQVAHEGHTAVNKAVKDKPEIRAMMRGHMMGMVRYARILSICAMVRLAVLRCVTYSLHFVSNPLLRLAFSHHI